MKVIPFLFASALALTAAAGWIAFRNSPAPGRTDSPDESAAGHPHAALHNSGSNLKPAASGGFHFSWSAVETNDYRAYIANLRSIKCPEITIRDIIIAEIDKYFAPREAPFKTASNVVAAVSGKVQPETALQKRARLKQDYERRRQLRTIELEKAAIIKQLLNYDLPLDPLRGWHTRNYERFEAAINSLPPEKREQVRAIQEAYWELSDALNDERADKLKGAKTAEYVQQYKENNDKRLAALGQVLTPAELENYEMRCSSVAAKLSGSLADFKPTEEEFRTIWRLRHEIEEPYGGMMTASGVDNYKADPQKEADAAAKLQTSLGDDRYAAYKRSLDPGYQTLTQLRTRFGLSQDTVDQAYAILQQNPQILQGAQPKVEIVNGQAVQTPAPEVPKDALEKLRTLLGNDPYTIATANTQWASALGH